MSWVGQAAGALGGGIQAGGAYKSGLDEANSYKYNAGLSEISARQTDVASSIELKKMSEEARSLLGTQEMAYAKAGVMNTGSALDVELKSAKQAEFDMQIARYDSIVQKAQYQAQASQYSLAAKSAKKSATLSLIGGMLGSVGSAVNSYYSSKVPQTTGAKNA